MNKFKTNPELNRRLDDPGRQPTHRATRFTELRRRASWSYGVDLSGVPIHIGTRAARLCEGAGAMGLASRSGIALHPRALTRPDAEVEHLLLHELAHMAQFAMAGSGEHCAGDPAARLEIEAEADEAARAALAGRCFEVAARRSMPRFCTAPLPLLFIATMTGMMLSAIGTFEERQKEQRLRNRIRSLSEDERKRIIETELKPNIYDTWWAIVPFVGSMDQMFNGDNVWLKLGGGVFFLLDLGGLGGALRTVVARATTNVTTGAALRSSARQGQMVATLVKPGPGAQNAVRKVVLEGGGSKTQREALNELVDAMANGEIILTGESQLTRWLPTAPTGGTYVITGTKGSTNHSVTYLVVEGEVYRLHGGPTRFIFREGKKGIGPVALKGEGNVAGKGEKLLKSQHWNSVTVYGSDELASKSDEALYLLVNRWQNEATAIKKIADTLRAPGCSATQAHVLKEFGVFETKLGRRVLPIISERTRQAGTGAHFVLNRRMEAKGTMAQVGTAGAVMLGPRVWPWATYEYVGGQSGRIGLRQASSNTVREEDIMGLEPVESLEVALLSEQSEKRGGQEFRITLPD